MTMDLESLITAVTERVMERMKLNKRAAKLPVLPVAVDMFFNRLALGEPITAPSYHPIIVKVATVRFIKALCRAATGQELKTATVTAKLKARGFSPLNDPMSKDSRHRFYIDGRQEVCYAFPTGHETSTHVIMKTVQELGAKYPELRNG